MSSIQINSINNNSTIFLAQVSPTSKIENDLADKLSQERRQANKTYYNLVWKWSVINQRLKDSESNEAVKKELLSKKIQIESEIRSEINRLQGNIMKHFAPKTEGLESTVITFKGDSLILKALYYLLLGENDKFNAELEKLEIFLSGLESKIQAFFYEGLVSALFSSGHWVKGKEKAEEILKKNLNLLYVRGELGKYYFYYEKNFEKAYIITTGANITKSYVGTLDLALLCYKISEVIEDKEQKNEFKKIANSLLKDLSDSTLKRGAMGFYKSAQALLAAYSDNPEDWDKWLKANTPIYIFRDFNAIYEVMAFTIISEKKGLDPKKVLECQKYYLRDPGANYLKVFFLDLYLPYKWLLEDSSEANIKSEQIAFEKLLPNNTAIKRYEKLRKMSK